MTDNNENVDEIIDALLSVRGARPGRQVNLTENQIRYLCTKTREILINQPVFLELEAPIKVCGKFFSLFLLSSIFLNYFFVFR